MSGLYVRFIIQLLCYSVNAQNLVFILRTGKHMVICKVDRDKVMDHPSLRKKVGSSEDDHPGLIIAEYFQM